MQLFVKSLAGNTRALEVTSSTSVENVKSMIAAREGIDADFQCLSFAGKSLQDSEALALYGVQDNSTLHLNAELLGGGKKRKKKTYTTPKKIKHKRTKVKLAILKMYKVDESGKITRLRRECPNATCGAGVFMAKHKDRQYCGKCHLTYVFQKTISLYDICKFSLGTTLVEAVIATDPHAGNIALIPKIKLTLLATEGVSHVDFTRIPFPARLAFAMTINKAHGQTLDSVGLYLPCHVFGLGQLYVALLRVRSHGAIKIMIPDDISIVENHAGSHTHNVVFKEVFNNPS
ncbi:hypothetical protein G6F42_017156 [Rhizopus arrhizus]|nr:hypothetical protein G6F42_017156 [Rhizopus arrhizus]